MSMEKDFIKLTEVTLSEKEQKLLDFITTSEEKATAQLIEEKVGKGAIGCLGRLLSYNLVEKKKVKIVTDLNKYGAKFTSYWVVKVEKKEEEEE